MGGLGGISSTLEQPETLSSNGKGSRQGDGPRILACDNLFGYP